MKSPGFLAKVVLAASVVALIAWVGVRSRSAGSSAAPAGGQATASTAVENPAAKPAAVPPMPATPPSAPTPGVALRPLAVARESAEHAWTAEDARTPEVIRKLAHNAWEERRMLEENPRITRRQLVYRKKPVFIAVERARATGEPLRTFTLPGFDGRELDVQITRTDLAPSGLSGTLTGRLPGLDESLVTLAFQQGTEAFTVASPEDGTYLQGHPREPGELMVSSFTPDAYLALPGGEPIRTDEKLKPAE